MEELTENAEEPDDGDSKKEEQKLGKLQYKVCHFQEVHLKHLLDWFLNLHLFIQTAGVWL